MVVDILLASSLFRLFVCVLLICSSFTPQGEKDAISVAHMRVLSGLPCTCLSSFSLLLPYADLVMSHRPQILIFPRRTKTPPTKVTIHIDSPHAWEYVRALAFCFEDYGGAVRPPTFLVAKTIRGAAFPLHFSPPRHFWGCRVARFEALTLGYKTTTIGLVKRVGNLFKKIKIC